MDINFGFPAILCALGFGLIFVAGAIPETTNNTGKTSSPAKSTINNSGRDKQIKRYHYSRTPIVGSLKNTNKHDTSPSGLWYAFDKNTWLQYCRDEDKIYKKGEKLYLYSISFKHDPKLFTVNNYEEALGLCANKTFIKEKKYDDMKMTLVDWGAMKTAGYDGIELRPGVIAQLDKNAIKSKAKKDVYCVDTLRWFSVDSGCLWNVDTVVLKEEGTVTV
jgi:hypothetical protein